MNRYSNSTGESAITHYEIGEDFIILKDNNKRLVEYSAESNTLDQIIHMKSLAQKGSGLTRYILKNKIKAEGFDPDNKSSFYNILKSAFSIK